MSQDKPHVTVESGGVSAPRDLSGNTAGRPTSGDGTGATSLFDRHPFLRRHRWFMAWTAASFLTLGVFVATHGTPGAQASDDPEVSCSSHLVAQTVGDILKEHVFASQAKTMLDEDSFGGKLTNIALDRDKPLTCSAGFVPSFTFSKAVLDDAKRQNATSQLPKIKKDAVDKYTAALKYKVRDDGAGGIRVDIVEGLDAFDD